MTSLPSPSPPPPNNAPAAAPTNTASSSPSATTTTTTFAASTASDSDDHYNRDDDIDNNNNYNDYGPVTKLAAIAAARAERERIQKRRLERDQLNATASLVGSTALAIAASQASGSPMRLSPAQEQSVVHRKIMNDSSGGGGSGGSGSGSGSGSGPNGNNGAVAASPKRMSVAARARAAADLPSVRHTLSGGGDRNNGPPRMPSSGNAGVTRGKFSKAQVEQMIDEWGKEDTSEEDDDDYYYDGTSDSSGGGDNIINSNDNGETGYERYKQSLERTDHHFQYTMSHPPNDPTNDRMGDVVSAERSDTLPAMDAMGMTEEEAEFHYQHHRVSAYSTASSRANQLLPQGNKVYRNDGEADDSGGLFATAKSWLQSQRDRLHQLELERQVQDQRRKLVEEGRRQRSMRNAGAVGNPATANGASNVVAGNNDASRAPQAQIIDGGAQTQTCEIAPSGSFGCMDGSQASGACAEDPSSDVAERGVVVTGMPNLCGFGGIYANQLDDSTDYSGVARLDKDGNVLEIIPSGSLESLEGEVKVCMKVSSPKCTLSGKGMSVDVDIAEDDDDCQGNSIANDALDANKNNSNKNYNNSNSNNNTYVEEEDDDDDDDPIITFESDIKIVAEEPAEDEEFSPSPQILQQSQMKSLISSGALPPSLNFCKWKRLYSLTRDGDSFEQFLRLVGTHDRTVLVVKTTHGRLFGGYADTRWEAKHFRQHSNSFYGSAQACLFRFPNYGSGRREDKISIYKWSGANRYIQLCDFGKRTVAFGGGGTGGGFGLCIEDDFRRGTTGHCSTFENEALCEEGYFDVMDMEVWGFALDYF